MRGNGLRLLVVLAALLAPLLLQPTPALALAFTVNSTLDEPDATPGDGVCLSTPSGVCTLRAAVMEANFLGGSHSITLPAGNFVLTIPPSGANDASTGDLNVSASLAITGAGVDSTVIDGNGTDRVFHVQGAVSLNFDSVMLRNKAPVFDCMLEGPIFAHFFLCTTVAGFLIFSDGSGAASATLANSSVQANAPDPQASKTFIPNNSIVMTGPLVATHSTFVSNGPTNWQTNAGGSTITASGSIFQNSGIISPGPISISDSSISQGQIVSNGSITSSHVTATGSGDFSASSITFENGTVDGTTGLSGTSVDVRSSVIRNAKGVGVSGKQVTVADSTLIGNGGGGISASVSLELTNSVISNSTASGVISGGAATVTDSKIVGNTASSGGGMLVFGQLTITRVQITGNTAGSGGGIYSTGALTITDSTINGNTARQSDGGGLAIAGGTATLTGVTISNNNASKGGATGGGIWMSEGTAGLTNVTINGNSAAGVGGGILLRDGPAAGSPTFDANYVTIANNSAPTGSGIEFASGTLRLANTIVANNTGGANCFAPTTPIVSLGHNLDSGTSCAFSNAADKNTTDPKLGPLTNNSGPTQTMALLSGSPAIDAGNPSNCPATDQRGIARPIDGDGSPPATCDIGAFEAPANTTPPPTTCTPRPPVEVTSIPDGSGGLHVAVTVTGAGSSIRSLQFGQATNAQIIIDGGPPNATGNFTVTPPAGAAILGFSVKRITAGQNVQVPFTVVDACGSWPTFTGGGPTAF